MGGICFQRVLMDIETSHFVQKLPLAFIGISVSGQDVADSQERGQTVILHMIPECIVVVICKEQFRNTGLHEILHISVHHRIVSGNPPVSLGRGIHRHRSGNVVLLHPVKFTVVFFQIIQRVLKIHTVHFPEEILRFFHLRAVPDLQVVGPSVFLILLRLFGHDLRRSVRLFHCHSRLIVCRAVGDHIYRQRQSQNSHNRFPPGLLFDKSKGEKTDHRDDSRRSQNQNIPLIFFKSRLIPTFQIRPSHQCAHRDEKDQVQFSPFSQVIPHPGRHKQDHRHQYKGIPLGGFRKIIKYGSSHRKSHRQNDQRRRRVQYPLRPFRHFRPSQDHKELHVQKNGKGGTEQQRILIIIHHIILRTFCQSVSVLQIAGKYPFQKRQVEIIRVWGKAASEPFQDPRPLTAQPGGYVEEYGCHRQKDGETHSESQDHLPASGQEQPGSFSCFHILRHQHAEEKIKPCGRQTHISKIYTVDPAEKYHHREKSSAFFLPDKFLAEQKQKGQINHRRSELVMLSPYQKKTVQSIYIGNSQFCLSAESKLRQKPVKRRAGGKDLQHLDPIDIDQHMSRSKNHPDPVQQHQEGIKQIEIKHIYSQSVCKIPQREIPVPEMVYDAGIIHDILLPGIAADVVKDHKLVSEQIIKEYDHAAYKQKPQKYNIISGFCLFPVFAEKRPSRRRDFFHFFISLFLFCFSREENRKYGKEQRTPRAPALFAVCLQAALT